MHKKVIIVFLAGLLAIGLVNLAIFKKETLLRNGETLFLELAPVDPRSLMQGDYMALRFAISNEIRSQLQQQPKSSHLTPQDGIVVITLTGDSVGKFNRINNTKELKVNERVLQYRVRKGQVKFATNAFFFQEGTAKLYQKAQYGEFRASSEGDILLTGLRDEALKKLGPQD